ncbi:MAG: polyprenyl synthetase family protein [Deltaproteobacteria bacterium]|nr:MAG: polyprenyl synthetase family protein [Deltaproteobacteria bacterium]
MYLERDPTPLLRNQMERLERCRRRLVLGLRDAPCGAALGEYLGRGKMLRASLVFLACGAVGGDPEEALMAAEAIELLHGASLFHDDLIDEADERRGLPALHRRVGQSAALVLGDYLLVGAFDALCKAHECHPAARMLDAVRTLSQLAQACCRGQLEELDRSDRPVSEESYLSIVRGKTAAPFMAASVLGALLGGGTDEEIENLRAYGLSLGVAFQIYDDLLDLGGIEAALGKPVGNSLAHGRPMLPLIYLREDGVPEEALRQLQGSEASPVRVMSLLEAHGALDRVRATQEAFIDAAVAAVANLPPGPDVEILRLLPSQATAWWAPPNGLCAPSAGRSIAIAQTPRGLGG